MSYMCLKANRECDCCGQCVPPAVTETCDRCGREIPKNNIIETVEGEHLCQDCLWEMEEEKDEI